MANRDVSIAAKAGTYGALDIAMSPYGSYWRNMRKLFVRDMLSNKNLEASSNLRKSQVKKAIKYVYQKIGTKIDVGALGFKTEMNFVMTMLWGGTLGEETQEKFASELRLLTGDYMYYFAKPNVSDFFPILARFDVQGVEKKMQSIARRIDEFLNLVIEERMKMPDNNQRGDGKKDFLQILFELRKHNDFGLAIDDTQIKAILLDIVIGGTDTTATSFEWVMTELLAHPESMEKVKQELENVVGTNIEVEEVHLPRLMCLDAVIKETLRLHPPLPILLPKYPSQSSIVGGYMIPKETKVFLNVRALHRDPQYWDKPSHFIPERFLMNDDNSKYDFDGHNFQFLPFGSGRRICPGIPLAERMLKYVLAAMLHAFEWRIPEGEEINFSENFGLVVKKSKPLLAIPSPRLLRNLELYE
ncbi:hypothetical protein Leryth_000861 [Lithospermum erythrorhizon]|nr:hypothetical protein Leryth_000861 [Lithospermum erythrorhizon]